MIETGPFTGAAENYIDRFVVVVAWDGNLAVEKAACDGTLEPKVDERIYLRRVGARRTNPQLVRGTLHSTF